MSAQGLGKRRASPDLSVNEADYFGVPTQALQNADVFGLEPEPEKDLYRVQYLYLLVFGNEDSPTDYGGIQVRASTHLYLEDGSVPVKYQRVMQRAAHRGAFLFDSSIEEGIYGSGGGDWADGGGYLSGFSPVENNADYRNWEVEPVPGQGKPSSVQPGVIRWTTEIYLEVDGTQYADLSGSAQGIVDPYSVAEHEVAGSDPVEAQQEWWQIGDKKNEARGAYQIAPQPRSSSRERAKNLRGKTVYINGLPVGTLVKDGRVWLKDEYQGGNTYRGDYSREGIISETVATPQALALGRKIAKVDESPTAVYLATAAARPDDFDPVDPDEIDPDREVRPGEPGGTVYILSLPDDAADPTRQECRQDRQVIKHLGYSDPPYSHTYAEMWMWPGFRPIAEHGRIRTPTDYRDDGQAGLDSYGGSDE